MQITVSPSWLTEFLGLLSRGPCCQPLALAAILTIAPGGPVISMLGGVSSGNWLPPSLRYTLAALPLYVLSLLAAADRRVVWLGGLIAVAVGLAAKAA